MSALAWVAEREQMRSVNRTSIWAVEVAVLLSKIHPADRRTYAEQHRSDWDARADLPPTDLLLRLASRVPGCRTDAEPSVAEVA